jgi:type II secretory pathway component PulC
VTRRALALLALAACGGGAARPDYPVAPEERLLDERRELPAPAPPPPAAGQVTRAALDEAIAAGPGALLAQVRVEAVRGRKGFHGWRLLAVPPSPAGLEAGDVLTRVNGKTLERPEHLSALFESLRGASEIVVESERGGVPRVVRVPVVE